MTTQELEEPVLKPTIIRKLRPFFDDNCTAQYASTKTNVSRKTVQKYWRVWSSILIEEMDNDFIKMQKEAKARGIIALDRLISQLRETMLELKILNDGHMKREKALWTKNKSHEIEINKWLTDKIAKYTKDIFNMEQIKILIQMKPTADITLQLQIDELLAKVKPEEMKSIMEEKASKEKKE